jgi:opacity protein-like surface antigen
MLRKLTLALVAAASLSAVALAPSAASAKPWGGGWGGGFGGGFHHHHWGHGFGIGYGDGYGDDGCYQTRSVMTPFGPRLRTVNVCAY